MCCVRNIWGLPWLSEKKRFQHTFFDPQGWYGPSEIPSPTLPCWGDYKIHGKIWKTTGKDPRVLVTLSSSHPPRCWCTSIWGCINGDRMCVFRPGKNEQDMPRTGKATTEKNPIMGYVVATSNDLVIVHVVQYDSFDFLNSQDTCLTCTSKVDNTVKECKNNSCLKWLCWLLLHKGLDLTGVMMSRVGHTHNSLGLLDHKSPCPLMLHNLYNNVMGGWLNTLRFLGDKH